MASQAAAASLISSNPCLFAPPLTTNHQTPSSLGQEPQQPPLPPPAKKKRSLPGTPDPDAEVIALSPRTLLATNRFVCEICGKGFQRDQNLQLHRRGHNLPWKLRQRNSGGKEPRKRVYVCPETACVHHNPARALGDLTGIKKHFCRKHGEKKWKCDKCNKRYAVQSDWKAHGKTCGTREYRCDCGTLFSRRDSFITHRAFCDALAEETARLNAASSAAAHNYLFAPSPSPSPSPSPQGLLAVRPTNMILPPAPPPPAQMAATHLKPAAGQPLCPQHAAAGSVGGLSLWGGDALPLPSMGHIIGPSGILLVGSGGEPAVVPPQLYADLFAPASSAGAPPQLDAAQLGWLCGSIGNGKLASSSNASELTSTTAASSSAAPASAKETDSSVPSVFSFSGQQRHHANPVAPADMSATALLQKAAQMGAVTSGPGNAMAMAMTPGALESTTGGNMPYDDVLSVVRRHAGLKDAAVAVGREETRDFLGVGMQALCSSSFNGWI